MGGTLHRHFSIRNLWAQRVFPPRSWSCNLQPLTFNIANCMKQSLLETSKKITGHYLRIHVLLALLCTPFARLGIPVEREWAGQAPTLSPLLYIRVQRPIQASSVACPPRILLAREYGDIFVGGILRQSGLWSPSGEGEILDFNQHLLISGPHHEISAQFGTLSWSLTRTQTILLCFDHLRVPFLDHSIFNELSPKMHVGSQPFR